MTERRDGDVLEKVAERVMAHEPDYEVTVTHGLLLNVTRRGAEGSLGETSSEELVRDLIGVDRERRAAQAAGCVHAPQDGTVYTTTCLPGDVRRSADYPLDAVCAGCGCPVRCGAKDEPWELKNTAGRP